MAFVPFLSTTPFTFFIVTNHKGSVGRLWLSSALTKYIISNQVFYFKNTWVDMSISANFCTVWRMNNNFYLYLPTFLNTLFNRLFISFSISFKYYFFIHYLLFFLTTTHLSIFFYSIPNYYNRKKGFEE